ncbi:hypothetical protein FHG87_001740 [Trinorchestia longiramus]|nr:hypothetical protein FHG87_001740 [Trinorchestia longiramus]
MAPKTSTTTRLAFIDQRANRTKEVNPATRLGLVTNRSTTLTNERQAQAAVPSQPPYTYNEAAMLCVTDSLPSISKVNISTKKSHHLKKSTHSQQQSKRSRNQPSCLRTG